MKNVLLIGAGKGGSALLRALWDMEKVQVIGVVDLESDAPAIRLAKEWGIPTGTSYETFLQQQLDVIIEATGSEEFLREISKKCPPSTTLVPGSVASLMMSLIDEKEELIGKLSVQRQELDVILNSTHDAMVAVNQEGFITLFNAAAERLTGHSIAEMIGTYVADSIPTSRLHCVLESGEAELNQLQWLDTIRIITNRVPVRDESGNVVGAMAVFRDVTEVQELAEEVTNLKEIQQLLASIIHSTQDAISVVDVDARGILINPAYTRLTGLTEQDVIGKPATVDIAEGESMHMQVLQTRQAVRGVHMKVGPNRKDVLVNVAPLIVEGELKGSVGIVHDMSEIQHLTEQLDQAKQLIRKLEAKYSFEDIIGSSTEMQTALEQAKIAATTHATVLLRGESGTGKELFAHAIHSASERRYNQFIRVNCAALSPTLLESELFGYAEGAFTGAIRGGKKGLFEEASDGTILLDEIGELSIGTQAKILRVLQEKEIVRVGSSKAVPVNVRVIAATNVNLEQAIKKGEFREDLYYRLNVLPIVVPPLRTRKEDIETISHRLIRKYNQEYGRKVERLAEDAIARLSHYNWPGNVRELENVLGRAIINMTFTETIIEARHLPSLGEAKPEKKVSQQDSSHSLQLLDDVVAEAEKFHIQSILTLTKGNKTEAARKMGISTRNLYYKLERHEIHE